VPESIIPYINEGNDYYRSKNYQNAINSFDKALRKEPNNISALTGKGFSLSGLSKFQQAINVFDKILQIER